MPPSPNRARVEPAKSVGPLKMIFDVAKGYPKIITLALVALVVTAGATLAIPA